MAFYKRFGVGLVGLLIAGAAFVYFSEELRESLLSWLYSEETVFAAGYSPSGWNGVKVGDRRERVVAALGEPLEKREGADGRIRYFYSTQGPSDSNYRMRILVVDREGVVREKKMGFYLD